MENMKSYTNILIIVDMQNDFITGSLGTPEAASILPNVVERIEKSRNELILLTQDSHETNYLETQEGKLLPVEHCIQGTWGWHLEDGVKAAWQRKMEESCLAECLDSLKIENYKYEKNTFGGIELVEGLKKISEDGHLSSITLAGLCTDVCVISNALLIKAFFPETLILVDASCCAGVTPESHQTALEAMKMCQIVILNQ